MKSQSKKRKHEWTPPESESEEKLPKIHNPESIRQKKSGILGYIK